MSIEAFEEMIQALRTLSEARQKEIRDLITLFKTTAECPPVSDSSLPPNLEWDRELLVYNGDILVEDPLLFFREQQTNDRIRRALGW